MNPGAPLDPLAIRAALSAAIGPRLAIAHDIRVVPVTGSTNDDAFSIGAPGLAIFAEHQTEGRGRRGDAWVSPPATNLLFSLLLHPAAPPETWTRLPHLAGIAVCRAVAAQFPGLALARLKWPNDVYLADRKLAGILVESRSAGGRSAAVVGIGLNVNGMAADFPEDLRVTATTLRDHTGHMIDRNALAAAILAEWAALYPAELGGDFSAIRKELRDRSWLIGREVTIRRAGKGEKKGTAADVGPEGELVVEWADGSREAVVSADRVRW